jgi:hypothetical protein
LVCWHWRAGAIVVRGRTNVYRRDRQADKGTRGVIEPFSCHALPGRRQRNGRDGAVTHAVPGVGNCVSFDDVQGPEGNLYISAHNGSMNDQIMKVVPS